MGFIRCIAESAKRRGRPIEGRPTACKQWTEKPEGRRAWLDRRSLIIILWLTPSLALLASVLIAPIRTSELFIVASRPESPSPDFAQLQDHPTAIFSSTADTDAVSLVNALPSEEEEQEQTYDLSNCSISSFRPLAFGKVDDHQRIAPVAILSHYPLRF